MSRNRAIRVAMAIAGVALMLTAFGLAFLRHQPLFALVGIQPALVALAAIFEHGRYGAAAPTANARPTGERFLDPSTKRLTEVFYDERSGERTYREVR